MDFSLNDDQAMIADAIDKLAQQFAMKPTEEEGFVLFGADLDRELEAGQYFEIAAIPEMGAVSAALAVERLAKLPFTVESALSMLVGPVLAERLGVESLPRPFSVIENGRPGRFADSARTLILIDGDKVSIAHPEEGDVEVEKESIYAYPMGRLVGTPEIKTLSPELAEEVRQWIRVACAAEMAGLIQAAIDCTVEHLSVRKQFGRPLGTFQALRHRMAECAVLAGGVRWLAYRAASTGDAGDAALAAFHAQDSATRICYDMHQMMGAMGMTLEMPLHLWTYRMKALLSELGGRGGQAAVVGERCFA